MSNLDREPGLSRSGGRAAVSAAPVHQLFAGKPVLLGSTHVRRLLPNLGRRLVGPWCFVDHYGPEDVATSPGMQIPAHPHIGLQTVSWLVDGHVHHRDSLGNDQLVRPGELGLMTAGGAITHAEHSPVPRPAMLHGVQLWVALPDAARATAPSWEHHADLPSLADRGVRVTLILGELAGTTSPGRTYSPLIGAEVLLDADAEGLVPVEPDFEHAVLVMSGAAEVDGVTVSPGSMLYLGCARRSLRIASAAGARLLLLGGEPFGEEIVMWWNFVARTNDEIVQARNDWETGRRFGPVAGLENDTVPAPPLPLGRLRPGGSTR